MAYDYLLPHYAGTARVLAESQQLGSTCTTKIAVP
jgi:hypothetical protein